VIAGVGCYVSTMTITVQTAPEDAGFDPAKLAAMDRFFQRYVDDGKIPGWHIVVARDGDVVHSSCAGYRDIERQIPVDDETRWRIFSMSKPITSVAAMILVERGELDLDDPISLYLKEFAEPRVYSAGAFEKPLTVPAREPIRVWHLLTHTSGLTYGFHKAHPVDGIYRANGFDWGSPPENDLAASCAQWARFPLLFEPGSEWNYSVSTDVLGRLIEVVSGQSLDDFLHTEVFEPLGMTDTGFHTDDDRLGEMYLANPVTGRLRAEPRLGTVGRKPPQVLSGGGGLVSTAADYLRFCEMLRGRGQYDGVRLLGSRTVDLMMSNHLPGNADLDTFGRSLYAESPMRGAGFGLGGSVVIDPVAVGNLCSVGEFSWGGAASTAFWVDPAERITVQFYTQLFPSNALPIRPKLRTLINSALID
jgi:CubicO group peptidase (beta-lactamase class C family)